VRFNCSTHLNTVLRSSKEVAALESCTVLRSSNVICLQNNLVLNDVDPLLLCDPGGICWMFLIFSRSPVQVRLFQGLRIELTCMTSSIVLSRQLTLVWSISLNLRLIRKPLLEKGKPFSGGFKFSFRVLRQLCLESWSWVDLFSFFEFSIFIVPFLGGVARFSLL
jgi:hypothetical protein